MREGARPHTSDSRSRFFAPALHVAFGTPFLALLFLSLTNGSLPVSRDLLASFDFKPVQMWAAIAGLGLQWLGLTLSLLTRWRRIGLAAVLVGVALIFNRAILMLS